MVIRRTFNFLPGVRVNLGRRGASVSIGDHGLHAGYPQLTRTGIVIGLALVATIVALAVW